MKKLKFLIPTLLICTCLIGFVLPTSAELKVTPTLIELNANKAQNGFISSSFSVQAGPNETIRIKVYPEYFKVSPKGLMEPLGRLEAKDSLVEHVRFVPNEFTLTEGRIQKVRLTVSDLNKLPDGESRMVLFLEDVAVKEIALPSDRKGISTRIIARARVGIPVYVDKGRYIRKASIGDLQVQKQNDVFISSLNLMSESNSRVRYRGKAEIIKDKKLVDEYSINKGVIGPYGNILTKGTVPVNKITENGDYTLRMILNYQDEKGNLKNLIKETVFTVEGVCPANI